MVCLVLLDSSVAAFSLPDHGVRPTLQSCDNNFALRVPAVTAGAQPPLHLSPPRFQPAAIKAAPTNAGVAPASPSALAGGGSEAIEPREPLGSSCLLHVRLLSLNLQKMVRFYTQLMSMQVLAEWEPQDVTLGEIPEHHPEDAPLLWGPLSGKVALPAGSLLPVDKVVLLGYRDEEGENGGLISRGEQRGLKLELIYSSSWAQQQKEAEAEAAAALRKEEAALLSTVAAFKKNIAGGQEAGSSSGSSLLPSLPRMRAFERRRGRYDRGHHGFFGLSFLLPSLQRLQPQQVQQAGGRLLHCPAKRKQVPSMIPDQDARQELWGQSCFLLDPDGNGVEVQQLTTSSSCSSLGLSEKSRKQEAAVNTWQSYMAEQEADITRQKKKQELLQQLDNIKNQLLHHTQQKQQRQGEPKLVERLKQQQQELQEQLTVFEQQQRVIDELEEQQRQRQQQEEARAAGTALQHKGPLSPRLQKVRLFTSSHVAADRFFGTALQMKLLRYKSHLLERLHPWTRFAATSRTYGCEAQTIQAKADADEGAAAAAATAAAAVAAAGEEGLFGGGSSVPTEWEGSAANDPPAAAAEVFRTEAAERTVPQLQVAYAFDEDVVSVHPGFIHVALGVKDVPAAAKHIAATDLNVSAEAATATESAALEREKCQPCTASPSGPAHFGGMEIVGDAEDISKPTKVHSVCPEECLVQNFDGYPILLVTEHQADAYYRYLQTARQKRGRSATCSGGTRHWCFSNYKKTEIGRHETDPQSNKQLDKNSYWFFCSGEEYYRRRKAGVENEGPRGTQGVRNTNEEKVQSLVPDWQHRELNFRCKRKKAQDESAAAISRRDAEAKPVGGRESKVMMDLSPGQGS
ncbi:uncharacterized protein LOC113147026 [Cyclospora cayetanensis]|uniref:Uncharacterized protein LOC113147026 n=1 Tax=Cyclospora cayetanensis TaxID=88456 RepID=A0A6P6RX05_9EIME|nr:uncharacterized protein LOC113147026 [Cyclospora cayetanensis]